MELVEAIRGLQSRGEIPDPYRPAASHRNQAPTFIHREPAQSESGLFQKLVSSVMSFRIGPEGAMASPIVFNKADQTCPSGSAKLQCFLDDVDTSIFNIISAPGLDQRKAGVRLAEVQLLIRLNGAGGAAKGEVFRMLESHFDSSHLSTRLRSSCLAGMPPLPGRWVSHELCDREIVAQLHALDESWQAVASELEKPARHFGLIEPNQSLAFMDTSRLQSLAATWFDTNIGHDGPSNEMSDDCENFVVSVATRAYQHTEERNAILRNLGTALHAKLQEPDDAGRARVDIIGLDDSNAIALEYFDLFGKDDLVILLEKETS